MFFNTQIRNDHFGKRRAHDVNCRRGGATEMLAVRSDHLDDARRLVNRFARVDVGQRAEDLSVIRNGGETRERKEPRRSVIAGGDRGAGCVGNKVFARFTQILNDRGQGSQLFAVVVLHEAVNGYDWDRHGAFNERRLVSDSGFRRPVQIDGRAPWRHRDHTGSRPSHCRRP